MPKNNRIRPARKSRAYEQRTREEELRDLQTELRRQWLSRPEDSEGSEVSPDSSEQSDTE